MSAAAIPDVKALRVARSRRIRAQALVVLVLAFLVVGLWAASLMFGESFYGPSEVWRVIAGERVPGASFTVGTLRLPRATLAVLAGLAFGSAGVTFQTLLRNQLASPDVIGISAGASAAGVIGIVILGLNETTVSLLALAAASYAQALRGGEYNGKLNWNDIENMVQKVQGDDPFGLKSEFLQLVRTAAGHGGTSGPLVKE